VDPQRKKTGKTKANLLAAACEIFAEKGYRDTTIAEICAKVGANNAAVNYHFGDKETLYREAWRYSFFESIKAHPPDEGVNENASAEEHLRGYIMSLVRRITDKNNKEFIIMQHEIAMPTGLLDEVVREVVQPLHRKYESIIRKLTGPGPTDMQVRFCAISVLSQCTTPLLMRREMLAERDNSDGWPYIHDVQAYAEHVVAYSLSGILALRARAEMDISGTGPV